MRSLLATVVGVSLTLAVSQAAAQQPNRRAELDAAFQKALALRKVGKHIEAIAFLEKAAALAPEVFGPDHLNTSGIYNTLGKSYEDTGKNRAAEQSYRRALQIREVRLGKDHLVAASLQNVGRLCWKQGNYTEAEALLRRCIKVREAKQPEEVPALAAAYHILAATYTGMGRYQEAEPPYRRSLALEESRPDRDDTRVAVVLSDLAELCRLMARTAEAEPLARRSVQLTEAKAGKDSVALIRVLGTLAALRLEMGDLAEAVTLLRRCLQIGEARLGKEGPGLMGVLSNLGLCYSLMGRTRESEAFYRRALEIGEAQPGKDNLAVATVLDNLGQLYQALGRRADAEPLLRRALAIREARLGKDHPEVAKSLGNLAHLYATSRRYQEAEDARKRALQIVERRLGKDHPEAANHLNALAVVYKETGRPREAEELFLRTLHLFETWRGKDHPQVAVTLHNLGTLYWSTGRLADAEKSLQRGLDLMEGRAGKQDPKLAFYLSKLAGLKMAQGHPREALELEDRALRLEQEVLQDVFAFSSESAMYAYLETVGGLLATTVSLAAAADSPEGATVGLTWALRRKGVVLDTLCRYRQLQQQVAADGPLAGRVALYRSLKQRLANAALTPPQGLGPDQLREQMAAWQKEAEALEAELNRALAQRRPAVADDWEQVSTAAVQRRLPARSALVEFVRAPVRDFKTNRWRKTHYFAFVLEPGAGPPRLFDLGQANLIDAGVAAVRKEFTEFQEKLRDCESPQEAAALEKAQEKQFLKTSAAFYGRLLAPLREALGKAELLYLAPDGDLNRLPFEALVDGEGKYLVERCRCAYLASGRDLLRAATPPAKGTVVFAGPDYRLGAPERVARAGQILGKNEQVASRGQLPSGVRSAGWKPLPGAAAEAGDIEKALGQGAYGPVKAYVGANALEEVLKALPAPRVLHLATHGFALDRQPDQEAAAEPDEDGAGAGAVRGRLRRLDNPLLRSGVVLAGANAVGGQDGAGPAEDGWVTAEEIALLDLRGCELVVLSACQTGLGDVHNGEGVYGLRRAFLYAGARSLVTSLFEVPDRETRLLMARFYANLAAGRGRLEALHAAQREMLQRRRQQQGAAHPFFWASFVLVGDPG